MIDFPNSPTLNQDYTVGTTTWTYDGAKWILKTYNSLHAVPVTAMMLWANTTYPTGWLLADGSAISRTTYSDLFAAIGTTYGVGDGSTTFNIPSMPSAGSGSPNTIIKVTNSGALEPSAISHASSHIRAGSDVIDGDRVSLDYVPTNYTRNSAASGAGDVTDLTAHLAGIDMILPAGMLMPYAGSTEPTGWVFCYGQTVNSVSNTAYARLWTAIGTTYGGASASSFILPDLRGRAVFGKDNMGGAAASRVTSGVSVITGTTLGAVGGSEALHTHTHTQDSHNHTQNAHDHYLASGPSGGVHPTIQQNGNNGAIYGPTGSTTATNQATTATNQNTGTGSSQNMPPTIITNYLIKL